ncbi:hypothetical protein [Nocardia sp. NPDC059239]|uniref:hypothetical protein n=1 Tax=unclassified Nocardia TaxID=2637762 RepID=UPI0036997A62
MGITGETLDSCGIADVDAAVRSLSGSLLHGNMNQFSDDDDVELMQRLQGFAVSRAVRVDRAQED